MPEGKLYATTQWIAVDQHRAQTTTVAGQGDSRSHGGGACSPATTDERKRDGRANGAVQSVDQPVGRARPPRQVAGTPLRRRYRRRSDTASSVPGSDAGQDHAGRRTGVRTGQAAARSSPTTPAGGLPVAAQTEQVVLDVWRDRRGRGEAEQVVEQIFVGGGQSTDGGSAVGSHAKKMPWNRLPDRTSTKACGQRIVGFPSAAGNPPARARRPTRRQELPFLSKCL